MKDTIENIKEGEELLKKVSELLNDKPLQTCVGVITHMLASISFWYNLDPEDIVFGFKHQLNMVNVMQSESSGSVQRFDKNIIH